MASTITRMFASHQRAVRVIFFVLLLGYVVLFVNFMRQPVARSAAPPILPCEVCKCTDSVVQNELVYIGKLVVDAHKHARSSKTLASLNKALGYIVRRLDNKDLDPDLTLRPNAFQNVQEKKQTASNEVPDVCPEVYSQPNSPYYDRGWDFKSCVSKPLHSIVTLVLNAAKHSKAELQELMKQIRKLYPTVPVFLSGNTLDGIEQTTGVTVFKTATKYSWLSMVEKVSTKYVVLLRDVHRLTNFSSIERLVSVSSRYGIPVVGGATVARNGHWWHGCYQTTLKNYTLAYEHGYDFSRDSCWFCDHLTGPFLAQTGYLQRQLQLLKLNSDDVVFDELFISTLSQQTRVMSCPDVMFHVHTIVTEKPETKALWLPLAKQYRLNRVVSYTGGKFSFTCDDIQLTCGSFSQFNGTLVAPCCFEKLYVCMEALINHCVKHNVFIGIRFGTLLGALKFKKALPWDIDGDFQYYDGNHSTLAKATPDLQKLGCDLHPSNDVYGYMMANGWYVDVTKVWGTPSLYYRQRTGYSQTYVLFNGNWVPTPPNPGRIMRLQYKHDIYRHANAHTHTGTSVYADYVPGVFVKCPGGTLSHSCLDQYYADGSLQFT